MYIIQCCNLCIIYIYFLKIFSRFMVIAQRPLLEGWKAVQRLKFKYFQEKASFAHNHVYVKPKDAKVKKIAFKN